MGKLKTRNNLIFYIFISLIAFIWMVPVIFMVLTSLKETTELYSRSIFSLPETFQWRNYIEAWETGNMSLYIRNSAVISIIKVPLGVFVSALAAFGLSRLNYKFEKSTFVFFVLGMTIPFQAALVPLVIMLSNVGLMNTLTGLIITYLGFGLPFAILMLTGFMKGIPKELDEAAKIDGCTNLGLFFKVILPVTKPALAALFIFDFLATWNEFLLAQVFINSDSMRPVTAGLMQFQGQHATNWPVMLAGVLLSVLPVLIVYVMFQKHFTQGLAGAVKG